MCGTTREMIIAIHPATRVRMRSCGYSPDRSHTSGARNPYRPMEKSIILNMGQTNLESGAGMASRPRRVGDEICSRNPRTRVGWDLAEQVIVHENDEVLAHLCLRESPFPLRLPKHIGPWHGLARLLVLPYHRGEELAKALGPLVLAAHVHSPPARAASAFSAR